MRGSLGEFDIAKRYSKPRAGSRKKHRFPRSKDRVWRAEFARASWLSIEVRAARARRLWGLDRTRAVRIGEIVLELLLRRAAVAAHIVVGQALFKSLLRR